MKSQIKYFREVLDLLGEDRGKLPWLVSIFVGSSLLDLLGLGIVGPYIALVINPLALTGSLGKAVSALGLPAEQKSLLYILGGALAALFFCKSVASILINRSILTFSQRQQVRLRSALMKAYQELPYTEYLRRNSSEYIYNIESLTWTFAGVVMTGLRLISDGIVAAALTCLLAWQNTTVLVFLGALLGLVVMGYDRIFRRTLQTCGTEAIQSGTTMVRAIHEGMEGLKEIRVLGRERYFHKRVKDGAAQSARTHTKSQIIGMAPRCMLEFIMVAFIVLLVTGTMLLQQDLQSLIPTLGVFGVAALRLMPSANMVSSSLMTFRYSRDSISQLHSDMEHIVNAERGEPHRRLQSSPTKPFQKLELHRVSFTYPNATRKALNQVSLELRAGESIGLIGPSGSGKTTLVDVLLGLLEPQSGEILYNEQPLSSALSFWRSQVAYLPQQVFLMDASLRRNVALGVEDEDIDGAKLGEALRQARLAEVVEQLPKGVDTPLGERGVRLSGGQRQRVALARAFYHEREVLVMDESTSALDNETEKEVVEEIKRLKGKKTMIVIAHRLTTVEHCDRIYSMLNGSIVGEEIAGNTLKPRGQAC